MCGSHHRWHLLHGLLMNWFRKQRLKKRNRVGLYLKSMSTRLITGAGMWPVGKVVAEKMV
jgi:hypothetical protein